jgi:hypothetical protein
MKIRKHVKNDAKKWMFMQTFWNVYLKMINFFFFKLLEMKDVSLFYKVKKIECQPHMGRLEWN